MIRLQIKLRPFRFARRGACKRTCSVNFSYLLSLTVFKMQKPCQHRQVHVYMCTTNVFLWRFLVLTVFSLQD